MTAMPQTDEAVAKILNKLEEMASTQGVELAGRVSQYDAISNLLYPLGAFACSGIFALATRISYAYMPVDTGRYSEPSMIGLITAILGIFALCAAVIGLGGGVCTYFDMANWAAARDAKFALARKVVAALAKSS